MGLAGCLGGGGGNTGGSQSSSGTMELTYWTLFTGGDGKVMKSMVEKFNSEKPIGDVKISRQRIPWDKYYDKLYTAMTGGNAPDLAISHTVYLRRFKSTLTDIKPYLSSDLSSKYVSSIWNAASMDGGQYAIPLDAHPVGLYYNQDILDEVGAKPPFDNFEEFEKVCNDIRDQTDKKPFGPDPYSGIGFRQWFSSVKQLDGQIVKGEGDSPTPVFDQGAGLEATKYYASVSGERNWDIPNTSENRVTKGIQNGNIAMTVNGTWYVNVLRGSDFNWGMMKPRITPGAKQLRTATDSHTFTVPKNPNSSEEKKKKAVKVAEWLSQENPEWGAKAGHLPAYKPILNGDQLRKADIWDVTLKDFMEMAKDEQLAYYPRLENFDFYSPSNWTWLQDAYAHNLTPQKAVNQGVKKWKSALQ